MLRPTAIRLPKNRILIPSYAFRNMSAPAQPAQQGWGSFIWTKLGYENLPQDVAQKSFYDLRAPLPGKDRWINMVSLECEINIGEQKSHPDCLTGRLQGQGCLDCQYRIEMVRLALPDTGILDSFSSVYSGFTPQYKGLQRLHDEYSDRGLVVIGFPCDQFGGQEPGNDQEIMEVRSRFSSCEDVC